MEGKRRSWVGRERRKKKTAGGPLTNREKQQFQAGRLSFFSIGPRSHTRVGAFVSVTHTCLPWLWTDKTRTERKCSRQRSTWAVMSLQLCVPRLCKSVSENLGCIPEQSSSSFYYCFVFIMMLTVNMASARLFSFSCFSLPKEEASCGACFFSAFLSALDPAPAYLKGLT